VYARYGSLDGRMLTDDEMLTRLETTSGDPLIVDDAYDLAQKQLGAEDAYAARLDARATSLFSAAGFSMTVAFSFGGWALLDHVQKVPFGWAIASGFVVVLAVGLAATWFALQGVVVKWGYKFVDEQDVFRPEIMAEGKKRFDYRIHLATHMWLVCQDRQKWNQARAKTIRRGQRCFAAFIGGILVLSAMTAASAILRKPDAVPATTCVCSSGVPSTQPARDSLR